MKFNPHGVRPFHRSDFYLLTEKILGPTEMLIYEFLINQAGFDPNNLDKYGVVRLNFEELALAFGYSSDNSVRTKISKMERLGILSRIVGESRAYRIYLFERHMATTSRWGGKSNHYVALEMKMEPKKVLQHIGSNIQPNANKVQMVENKADTIIEDSSPRYLSSSKVSSVLGNRVKVVQSVDFYKSLVEPGEYSSFTADDARWVSEEQFPTYGPGNV